MLPVGFTARLRPAAQLKLHGDQLPRTDCNSTVMRLAGRAVAFISHYVPIGHSYRRLGDLALNFAAPLQKVELRGDPDPAVGKWIEAVWRDPSGRFYGWYHAEEVAPCPRKIFAPHIGALVSDDEGASWRFLGELLRSPAQLIDCDANNGFMAGGYGDFCVLPDRDGLYFYVYFTSFVSDETAQGICVARYRIDARERPAPTLEIWSQGQWQRAAGALPSPIWKQARAWRHADPDGFWGPSIHFNRDLGVFVMLLNRTAGGTGNFHQEGAYVSFNARLDDPTGWGAPERIFAGGDWYPQAIGMGAQDSDTLCGAVARFFMAGTSDWEIEFLARSAQPPAQSQPVP